MKRLVNHRYFEFIDTPDKAYWFGFLAADGYAKHQGRNYRVIINLKEIDIQHLEKFKKEIGRAHV